MNDWAAGRVCVRCGEDKYPCRCSQIAPKDNCTFCGKATCKDMHFKEIAERMMKPGHAAATAMPFKPLLSITEPTVPDAVNNPTHYTQGGIEVIDAIEAWSLNFCLGNSVKYIARAGKKDPAKHLEDLRKARWYLDREITNLEADLGE